MMDSVVMFQGTIYEKGYGWIPRQVMRDKKLKWQSKAIYSYICSFASNSNSGERTAFPSVELQCAELGITENTYFTHRKSLIEKGYLKIERQRSDTGNFDSNLYIICSIPIPLEPEEPKKPIPQNLGYGENLDVEPFEPYPKNSGMDEPYLKNPCTVNPSMVNSGAKTNSTKITRTKKNNSLVSSSRESNLPFFELIDKQMKKAYPDIPFDEIREELINDETADIGTVKQYHAMLLYRIELHIKKQNARKQPSRPSFKAKKPVRKEILPNWFDEENEPPESSEGDRELTDEEKKKRKAEIEDILKDFRTNK